MTDKKFTDEEIMEALANCAFSAHNPDACKECHYNNVGAPICIAYCTKDALELMYRQESESNRLQKEVSLVSILFQDLQEQAEEYRLKIENLQNVISNQQIEISAKIEKRIKAEAYKEFAEKLQAFCKKIIAQKWNEKAAPISWSYAYADFIDDIDNLLKEMVGE